MSINKQKPLKHLTQLCLSTDKHILTFFIKRVKTFLTIGGNGYQQKQTHTGPQHVHVCRCFVSRHSSFLCFPPPPTVTMIRGSGWTVVPVLTFRAHNMFSFHLFLLTYILLQQAIKHHTHARKCGGKKIDFWMIKLCYVGEASVKFGTSELSHSNW